MRSRHKMYVVRARNGGMIARSWDQACFCRKYLRVGYNAVGTESWADAQRLLRRHLEQVTPPGCYVPNRLEVGRVITVNSLMGMTKDILTE